MSKRLVLINLILTAFEFLICLSVIAAFSYAAFHFSHWWINLFSLLPLALFSSHGLIVDSDIAEAKRGEEDGR